MRSALVLVFISTMLTLYTLFRNGCPTGSLADCVVVHAGLCLAAQQAQQCAKGKPMVGDPCETGLLLFVADAVANPEPAWSER